MLLLMKLTPFTVFSFIHVISVTDQRGVYAVPMQNSNQPWNSFELPPSELQPQDQNSFGVPSDDAFKFFHPESVALNHGQSNLRNSPQDIDLINNYPGQFPPRLGMPDQYTGGVMTHSLSNTLHQPSNYFQSDSPYQYGQPHSFSTVSHPNELHGYSFPGQHHYSTEHELGSSHDSAIESYHDHTFSTGMQLGEGSQSALAHHESSSHKDQNSASEVEEDDDELSSDELEGYILPVLTEDQRSTKLKLYEWQKAYDINKLMAIYKVFADYWGTRPRQSLINAFFRLSETQMPAHLDRIDGVLQGNLNDITLVSGPFYTTYRGSKNEPHLFTPKKFLTWILKDFEPRITAQNKDPVSEFLSARRYTKFLEFLKRRWNIRVSELRIRLKGLDEATLEPYIIAYESTQKGRANQAAKHLFDLINSDDKSHNLSPNPQYDPNLEPPMTRLETEFGKDRIKKLFDNLRKRWEVKLKDIGACMEKAEYIYIQGYVSLLLNSPSALVSQKFRRYLFSKDQ